VLFVQICANSALPPAAEATGFRAEFHITLKKELIKQRIKNISRLII